NNKSNSISDVAASFLRVESGHQRISIDGRKLYRSSATIGCTLRSDPYMGFFTRLLFNEPTCISSLTVHCLKPLTGAEEIDILFSECEHGHWKVVHYTNTKERFFLKKEVIARQLSISSPIVLSVIDVQVETCGRRNVTLLPSIQYVLPDVYRSDASPYEIPLDVLIPEDRTVVIQPGVTLRFGDEAGFTVRGVLIVNGTRAAPVTFEPRADRWKGIEIINAVTPSKFSFANVTGSVLGITLRSGVPPSIDNVISTSNQYGFDFQTSDSVRIVNSSALNNEKSGFRISSKVVAPGSS
ncbi:unnamed protein product, partial [Heligmosomoides polygyrus]|uniref:ZU5 domain-containing protein n=1 Tax=Heligmosomoides polygyrus TaxID=6339 RepID=A0A183FJ66_HELPZ